MKTRAQYMWAAHPNLGPYTHAIPVDSDGRTETLCAPGAHIDNVYVMQVLKPKPAWFDELPIGICRLCWERWLKLPAGVCPTCGQELQNLEEGGSRH